MKHSKNIKRRAVAIYLFMILLALVIIIQPLYTQIFESHLYNTENYNVTRTVTVPASRGNIYSDDLSLLATSIPEYEIRWDAKQVDKELFLDEVEELSSKLSELFNDKPASDYFDYLRKVWAKQSRYALIKRKVNYNQLKLLKQFPIFSEGRYKGGFQYKQLNIRQKPFQQLAGRTIGYHKKQSKSVGIEGAFNYDLKVLKRYMAELREIKTQIEVSLIRKAVRISAQGQREVMKALHAEMTEREVQGIHQYVFKKYGAAHEGYPSIVGAGHNGCVLHYITNDKENINNQLILMDLGAEYKGYTADVTRTVPVTGKFTQPQKELYKIVYASQQAGIKAAQVGADFKEIREACYEVVKNGLLELGLIDKPEDFRRYLPHGVAHHIGLDVHDPGLYEKLAENMIITVEPGIYVPKDSPCDPKYWDIGIRIEDDVLITKEGPITLSDEAPIKWDEIEALMAESSPLDNFVLPEIED